MARSFLDVINRARIPLQDADKTRFSDADLLAYANDAVLLMRKNRPDLFYNTYGSYPINEYGTGDPLPVSDEYFPAIADYVTARAEFREDEDAVQARASSFFQLWQGNS